MKTMRGGITLAIEFNDYPDGSAEDVAASVQNALGYRAQVRVVSAFLARPSTTRANFHDAVERSDGVGRLSPAGCQTGSCSVHCGARDCHE